ncbi:transporter [Pedobacter aquatilis]|uniref:transporter n=1 Tax=Pedobacter aquatilis TaxID=351343 RepID=UPI00292D1FA7|nr:transporter [Pedobacter aquatilis]
MKNHLIFAIFCLISFNALGQKKQSYSVLKPVPNDSLREIETDRPDVSESPKTVDAGHFQIETDLFRFQRQRKEQGRTDEYVFNQMNIKLGLTRSTAIQLNFGSYAVTKDFDDEGQVERSSGFGDLTLRVKQNLLGNDRGNFAIALLPYLKFPTSKAELQREYEGGIIIPMSIKVGDEWKLGMQVEADRLKDEEGKGHHNELLQTLTLSHSLKKNVEAIIETYYTYEIKAAHFENFLNAALQVELSKDILLDGGLNYGLQHEARKSYFVGLSIRL